MVPVLAPLPKLDGLSLDVCANLARVWSAFNPTFNPRLPGAHSCKFNFAISHAQALGGHARQEQGAMLNKKPWLVQLRIYCSGTAFVCNCRGL